MTVQVFVLSKRDQTGVPLSPPLGVFSTRELAEAAASTDDRGGGNWYEIAMMTLNELGRAL
jgi:hypothetical protein